MKEACLADPIEKDPASDDWPVVVVEGIQNDEVVFQFAPQYIDRLSGWGWLREEGKIRRSPYLQKLYQYFEYQLLWREKLAREVDAKRALLHVWDALPDPITDIESKDRILGPQSRFELLRVAAFTWLCAKDVPAHEWLRRSMAAWGVPLGNDCSVAQSPVGNEAKQSLKTLQRQAAHWVYQRGAIANRLERDDYVQIVIEKLLTGRYETLPACAAKAKVWLHNKLQAEVTAAQAAAQAEIAKYISRLYDSDTPLTPDEELERDRLLNKRQEIETAADIFLKSLPKELNDVLDACEEHRFNVSAPGSVPKYGSPVDGHLRLNYRREVAEILRISVPELQRRLELFARLHMEFVQRFKLEGGTHGRE
jgi:hypothetical protein